MNRTIVSTLTRNKMKKKTLFKNMRRTLPLCILFLVAGLISCDRDLNEKTPEEIKSGAPDEIARFFNTHGDAFIDSITSFFYSKWTSPRDTCFLINSHAELQETFAGDNELPEIDFEKNSIIIGMVMENDGRLVNIKSIDITKDSIVVNVRSVINQDGEQHAFLHAYYPYFIWGWYDKLPQRKIAIKRK